MSWFSTTELPKLANASVSLLASASEDGISGYAFGLLMVAAMLHGLWNLAARTVKGDGGVLACSIAASIIWLAPFAVLCAPIPTTQACIEALPFVIATGLLHAVYIYLVGAMYAHAGGDVSMVYPIARGTGVTITAILAGHLLQEAPSRAGWMGIATVVVGIFMISQKPKSESADSDSPTPSKVLHNIRSQYSGPSQEQLLWTKGDGGDASPTSMLEDPNTSDVSQPKDGGSSAVTLALLTGCCISSYSLCDQMGLYHMHPTQYILGMNVVNFLSYAPLALQTAQQRQECWTALHDRKKYIAVIGCGSSTSSLIVLCALSFTKASYVVAVREVSILFGAMLGIVFYVSHCTSPK